MHELSIVMNIIDIAHREVNKVSGSKVESIELDIGVLAGVDPRAFEFAWKHGRKGTMLEQADCQINNIMADGHCPTCNYSFEISDPMPCCPKCKNFLVNVKGGRALTVKRLSIIS